MRHPLALTAELVLTGRKDQAVPKIYAPRPKGDVVWLHIGLADVKDMAEPLAERLLAQRPDLTILVTVASDLRDPGFDMARVIGAGSVPENATEAKAFIAHFAPDMGLWAGGGLSPAILAAAAEADVPMALIAATQDGLPAAKLRWRSSVTSALLQYFSAVYATTANAEKRLAQFGVTPETLHLVGPMQVGATPPGCDYTTLDTLRELLRSRTLWVAAQVQADEVDKVLDAHRHAARFDPRALLILHPARAGAVDKALQEIEARGLSLAHWDQGEMPKEQTQVLVTTEAEELGLWHRLAPVSFIGSSLTAMHVGRSPWPAASLGSAVLCGVHVEAHRGAYARLFQNGAARAVQTTEELSAALTQLSAPDRAAAMAHAGWQVATMGSEATDRVIDLVQDTLDAGGLG